MDQKSSASATSGQGHTPRWTAPEILWSGSPATKESDIFSFGMVTIEVGGNQSFIHPPSHQSLKVFTGRVPFSGTGAPAVMRHIMAGRRPGRPDHPGFTEQLWTLTQRCWDEEAQGRPEIQEVAKALGEPSASNQPWDCLVRCGQSGLFAPPTARNASHQCCKFPIMSSP